MRRLALGLCLLGALAVAAPASASFRARGSHRVSIHRVAKAGQPLPDRLVIRPGYYRVGGRVFDMRREGYYQFGHRVRRIVYYQSVQALLSGIAWATSSTGADDTLDEPRLEAMAMVRKPGLTCGYVVEFARYLLARQGIVTRAVASIGLSPAAAHTMIEVDRAGRWTLYDLYYNAQPLSAGQATNLLGWERRLSLSFRPLAADDNVASAATLSDPGYLVVFGTALVSDPAQTWPYYFTTDDLLERLRITGYYGGYLFLPPDQFHSRFYP
jgi:hypothetical protein